MHIVEFFVRTHWIVLAMLAFVGTVTLYLLTAGLAFLFMRRLKKNRSRFVLDPKPYTERQIRDEVRFSLFSMAVLSLNAPIIGWGTRTGWMRIRDGNSFSTVFVELAILLLWNEIHFFLAHRLLHTRALMRFHAVHHAEPNVSPLSIFRFHPIEAAVLGSVIPLALILYPFHIENVLLFVFASMLLNVLGHSGFKLRTSERHFEHHKYHRVNFGFAIPWFDQILGTTTRDYLSKIKERRQSVGMALKNWMIFLTTVMLVLAARKSSAEPANTTVELDEYLRNRMTVYSVPKGGKIELQNLLPESTIEPFEAPILKLNIECDGPVRVIQGSSKREGRRFQVKVWPSQSNSERTLIEWIGENSSTSCEAKGEGFRFLIKPEAQLFPAVARLRAESSQCVRSPELLDGCSLSTDGMKSEVLKDPRRALSARFKMLMGYDLTEAEYIKKDPNMALDFSKAPKLDLIVVDTLQIMKDFVGVLTLRMLSAHASRGTRIYFMTSSGLLLQKESDWLRDFVKNNPTVHFVSYRSIDDHERVTEGFSKGGISDYLAAIHRSNHIKVFLTLSESDPQKNAMIVGGRNLSEMYFFESKPTNKPYPDIIQWNEETWYNWVYFNDLDVQVIGTRAAREMAKALIDFNESKAIPSGRIKAEGISSQSSGPDFSFMIASPLGEGSGRLEKAYIQLIDAAKTSLKVVSPYLNLTDGIREALYRAKNRNVKIEITTNIHVEGDFMPGFLQPAMNRSIRKLVDEFNIRHYSVPERILHVKAMLIDGSRLVLGSVNLNRRSFAHDTEVALLFTDPNVIAAYNRMFETDILPWLKPLTLDQLPPKSLMESVVKPWMGEL